jgi:hypothetical protein
MSKKFPGGFISKNPVAPTNAAAKGVWSLTEAANYTKQGIWPKIPGAPTIGTATAVTATTATVTYTAPTNLGAGTVTYTATSSPGGLTGTGASPITVSGLTGGTSYTFTVTASTPGGTSPASAASNSITTILVIGQAYGGGFYAGQISTAGNGVADYNLVVGPVASAQSTGVQWKTTNTTTAGTTSDIDGPTNSSNMNNASHPAAQFCEGLTIGGFSDWYMPAKNELEVCYYNLKPSTVSNITSAGINPNAVPARASNYTTGNPAQTTVTDFQIGGAEAFTAVGAESEYWSSTEQSASLAWVDGFRTGNQFGNTKTGTGGPVRAVRRVAV